MNNYERVRYKESQLVHVFDYLRTSFLIHFVAHYKKELSEVAAVGTSVITVSAIDKDLGENAQLKYSFDAATNVVSWLRLLFTNT